MLSGAAIALTIWWVAGVASFDDVTTALDAISREQGTVLVGFTVLNVVTYWLVLSAAIPGLGIARSGAVQLPSTALSNVAPGGGALGTAFTVVRLRAWGFPLHDVAAALLVNGVMGTAAKLAAGVTAVVVLAPDSETGLIVVVLALVVLVACVTSMTTVLASSRTARLLGRLTDRPPMRRHGPLAARVDGLLRATARLQRDVGRLAASRRVQLIGATVLSHAVLFALFVVCFRTVGIGHAQVSTVDLLRSFAVARVMSLVPLTPGGIGLIEVSLTASLTAGGGDTDLVVAGVALYRLATYAVPTVLGAGGLVIWSFVLRADRREPQEPSVPTTDVPLVVDLDGTLLPVTTRSIMASRLLWRQPRKWRTYCRHRRRDRLGSKYFLWEAVGVDLASVPIRRDLMRSLARDRDAGRAIYLVSGAPDALVRSIVERYDVFTDGWGSEPGLQLVGEVKASSLTERFGHAGFDYVGDAAEDLAVWRCARQAVVYWPSRRLEHGARLVARDVAVVGRPRGALLRLAGQFVWTAVRQHPWGDPGPRARGRAGAVQPARQTPQSRNLHENRA